MLFNLWTADSLAANASSSVLYRPRQICSPLNPIVASHVVLYINSSTKVKILCATHGEFEQVVNNHLRGAGCPSCSVTGYTRSKPGTLYYVRFDLPGLTLWKIGITNTTIKKRFASFKVKPVIIWQRRWKDGNVAADQEKRILREGLYDIHRYKGEPLLEGGNTECFTTDIMVLGNTTKIHQLAA